MVVAPPRLPGLLSCRSSTEGWEFALLPGTVLCRTVRTALDLIAHLGSAHERSPFFIALPRRVGNHGTLMQVCKKARKDRSPPDRECLKSSRALQLYRLFDFRALPVFLAFSVYSIFSVLLRSQRAQ